MYVLTDTFKVLTVCGVWLPLKWQDTKTLIRFYNFYSALIIVPLYIMVSLQILLFALSEFKVDLIMDILFTMLTGISVCAKMTNFLVRRGKVMYLANMLLKSWCLSRDEVEIDMEKKTDNFIRLYTIFFNIASQVTTVFLIISPLFEDTDRPKLPFLIWTPYELYEGNNYWITMGMEIVPLLFGVLLNTTTDVLVSGFVLQACRQFYVIKHRLMELPDLVKNSTDSEMVRSCEEKILKETALHHDYIFSYTKVVMETFDLIIVEQFFASVIIFSVIVFQLSMDEVTTVQKIMAVLYLFCMLTELFTYCWFGNEITLKSEEFAAEVYGIDWTVLSKKANRKLLFIMLRTRRPIVMTYRNIVVFNIESFKSILKVTYSAFNVLKESADAD